MELEEPAAGISGDDSDVVDELYAKWCGDDNAETPDVSYAFADPAVVDGTRNPDINMEAGPCIEHGKEFGVYRMRYPSNVFVTIERRDVVTHYIIGRFHRTIKMFKKASGVQALDVEASDRPTEPPRVVARGDHANVKAALMNVAAAAAIAMPRGHAMVYFTSRLALADAELMRLMVSVDERTCRLRLAKGELPPRGGQQSKLIKLPDDLDGDLNLQEEEQRVGMTPFTLQRQRRLTKSFARVLKVQLGLLHQPHRCGHPAPSSGYWRVGLKIELMIGQLEWVRDDFTAKQRGNPHHSYYVKQSVEALTSRLLDKRPPRVKFNHHWETTTLHDALAKLYGDQLQLQAVEEVFTFSIVIVKQNYWGSNTVTAKIDESGALVPLKFRSQSLMAFLLDLAIVDSSMDMRVAVQRFHFMDPKSVAQDVDLCNLCGAFKVLQDKSLHVEPTMLPAGLRVIRPNVHRITSYRVGQILLKCRDDRLYSWPIRLDGPITIPMPRRTKHVVSATSMQAHGKDMVMNHDVNAAYAAFNDLVGFGTRLANAMALEEECMREQARRVLSNDIA